MNEEYEPLSFPNDVVITYDLNSVSVPVIHGDFEVTIPGAQSITISYEDDYDHYDCEIHDEDYDWVVIMCTESNFPFIQLTEKLAKSGEEML